MSSENLSMAYAQSMCPDCYFILDTSAAASEIGPCPNCGKVGISSLFPDSGHLDIFDMMEYFHQRGLTMDSERVRELASTVYEELGLTFEAEKLAQTALAAQEVYDRADQDARWSDRISDEMVRTVQNDLALPTYDEALKVWGVIGLYSAMTHDHKMVVILANMLLEQLLDGRLIVLAVNHDSLDLDDAEDKVYEKLGGIDAKRRFFVEHLPHFSGSVKDKAQVNTAFNNAMGKCGPADFCSDWDMIRQVRNLFVHENVWAINIDDVHRALRLAYQSIPVFARVQNQYCLKARTSL